MEHLYDTHFHLDLQKDRAIAIREIEEHQIYTIAVTCQTYTEKNLAR